MIRLSLVLALFILFSSDSYSKNGPQPASLTNKGSIPELWFEDNNMYIPAGAPPDFKEKFDKLDSWKETRKAIRVYLIRANTLYNPDNKITDNFLKEKLIPVLKKKQHKAYTGLSGCNHERSESALYGAGKRSHKKNQ